MLVGGTAAIVKVAAPAARCHAATMAEPEPGAEPGPITVAGNRLTLLESGPERLDALITLIDGARHSLRLLYYIYVDDAAGQRVRAALAAARARGVAVYLIVDGFGSDRAVDQRFFEPLRAAGADVCLFVPRFGRRYFLRNHQKLALADGEHPGARVIVGGFNIEASYFGTLESGAWRDLGLLVEGPAAARLTGYFDALRRWTHQPKATMRALRRALSHWSEPEGSARWLLGGPARRLSPWARVVKRDMQAGGPIDIISAYFAPSPAMLRRLTRAARRARVRVVLPSLADHAIAVHAARFTEAGMLRKGVEVFEYQATKLHTKLYLIGDTVHIGSANFDMRSLFLNLELMLRVEDAAFAAAVRGYVEGEIARSERITPALHRARMTPWRRVKQAGAYLVMAVLDPTVSWRLNMREL
jgi:cardiolipin synthase